ncbi:hypothetical protein D3C81_1972250 [compost metagenome]
MLATGFAAGIYVLPILTEQAGASIGQVQAVSRQAAFSGAFRKDLAGSDAFHWASGRLHVSARAIAFEGSVAPGRTTGSTWCRSSWTPRRLSLRSRTARCRLHR